MKKEYKLLKKVSEVQGISGDEKEVAMLIKDELKDIATFEYDNLGSTIAYLNKDSDQPKVLLTAHMDEVGFIVSSITPEGFIKMSPIGGWSQKRQINILRHLVRFCGDGTARKPRCICNYHSRFS